MKIPKEIGMEVKEFERLMERCREIMKDVQKWAQANGKRTETVMDISTTHIPEGMRIGEGEFLLEEQAAPGAYHGNRYFEIEGSPNEYVVYTFICMDDKRGEESKWKY